ncbi:Mor transcription activator family protein [Thaumasiovibrio subtropicus]|uniref:Mor transcription activator family protein n=1 Tax=Thaumasiovibrio subtropicus TaxID=1891207 RepID=UPI00131AD5C3|nr:Mor transcription activator family protein [Thaumasiovibrio subtropicus]
MQCETKLSIDLSKINPKILPPKIQILTRLIGLEEVYSLVVHFGGKEVYIPKDPSNTTLINKISKSSIEELSREFGGTYLSLPTHQKFYLQDRNRNIYNDLCEGYSRSAVAEKYNLGVRQVANIKKEMAKDDR